MSDARRIADERFAKGEITEDEYDKIISRIGSISSKSDFTVTKEILDKESPTESNLITP